MVISFGWEFFLPLSLNPPLLQRRGGSFFKRGLCPLKLPFLYLYNPIPFIPFPLTRGRGSYFLKRGKAPHKLPVIERGEAPLGLSVIWRGFVLLNPCLLSLSLSN
jgi:hypothetical protein